MFVGVAVITAVADALVLVKYPASDLLTLLCFQGFVSGFIDQLSCR
jgi:hypothetical protein